MPATWTSGTDGWQVDQIDGAGASIGNVASTLQLVITNAPSAAAGIYANGSSSSGNFVGNYYSLANDLRSGSSNLVVQFDLQTLGNYNDQAGMMLLYFVGNGNQYIYSASLTQPVTNQLTHYSFLIGSATDWFGTNNTFNADFNNVSQIGLQFYESLGASDSYIQLSNFELNGQLQVPEPETVWMIVMVLASLAVTFRGRLSEMAGQVKARFTA